MGVITQDRVMGACLVCGHGWFLNTKVVGLSFAASIYSSLLFGIMYLFGFFYPKFFHINRPTFVFLLYIISFHHSLLQFPHVWRSQSIIIPFYTLGVKKSPLYSSLYYLQVKTFFLILPNVQIYKYRQTRKILQNNICPLPIA